VLEDATDWRDLSCEAHWLVEVLSAKDARHSLRIRCRIALLVASSM